MKTTLKKKPKPGGFVSWCANNAPRLMRLLKAKSGDNPFTFLRNIEVPVSLGKSGLQLLMPIPDQISKADGSGPVSDEALQIWAAEVWKLLRGQWERTYDGMKEEMRRTLREFEKVEPHHARRLMDALQCDDKAETFQFVGGVEDSVAAFGKWSGKDENS